MATCCVCGAWHGSSPWKPYRPWLLDPRAKDCPERQGKCVKYLCCHGHTFIFFHEVAMMGEGREAGEV